MSKKDSITSFIVKSSDTFVEVMLLYLGCICVAALALMHFENWPALQSFWFCFVAATSTGFGDVTPQTFAGKATAVVLMHVTIFVIIPLAVARILSVAIKNDNEFTDGEQREMMDMLRKLTQEKERDTAGTLVESRTRP